MIQYPSKGPDDSDEDENYCYYNEDDETDAIELDEIIQELIEEGVSLDQLFDPS